MCYYAHMKRTTVVIPDELAVLLDVERRRRDTSVAQIVREALEAYLRPESNKPKPLRFAALGHSGQHDTAREAEAIIAEGWGDAGGR